LIDESLVGREILGNNLEVPVVALAVTVVALLTATLVPPTSTGFAGIVALGSRGLLEPFPAMETVLVKDASTPNSRPLAGNSMPLATVGPAVCGVSARTVG